MQKLQKFKYSEKIPLMEDNKSIVKELDNRLNVIKENSTEFLRLLEIFKKFVNDSISKYDSETIPVELKNIKTDVEDIIYNFNKSKGITDIIEKSMIVEFEKLTKNL